MRKDSKLSDVLHVLLHMKDLDQPLTSDYLAKMMQTNPVVVRRTLSGLRERGLVASTKGRSGGWVLTCDFCDVSLLQIYQAVGESTIFSMGSRNKDSTCLVEKAVNNAVGDVLEDAQALIFERFANTTLDSLFEGFSEDLAAAKASLELRKPSD